MIVSSADSILIPSRNWQESLQIVDAHREAQGAKLNYAAIARRAGIKSRSYVRMLFRGEKTPSLTSLESILTAVKVSPSAKKFILMQWQLDHVADQPTKHVRLREQIEKLKIKLAQGGSIKSRDQIYSHADTPTVFASLGRVGRGVSFDDIKKKTNLPVERIQKAVDVLVQEGVAAIENSSVLPLMNQIVMEKESSATFFKNFYLDCLRKSQSKSEREFSNKENLFSGFAVSIDPAKQKQHADKLYNLLVDFLAEIEDPDGDSVVIMNAALHKA